MDADKIYSFGFRGLLAEEALDACGRKSPILKTFADANIAQATSLEMIEEVFVGPASEMATVYTAITAFENSVRRLIAKQMLEAVGAGWWETKVSDRVKKFAASRKAEEEKTRWHGPRGGDPIEYTDFSDLSSIIATNWAVFEPHFRSLQWVQQLFDALERSRNVIMHSGTLSMADIERVGVNIRDWVTQVGS